MPIRSFAVACLATMLLMLGACATAPQTKAKKADLTAGAEQVIRQMKSQGPVFEKLFKNSAGYAVFPMVAKGGVGFGGAYGRGVLYESGRLYGFNQAGYCDLTQGSIGLQLGGQAYSEVIFFQTRNDVEIFKTGNFSLAAQASAVVIAAGISHDINYSNGVIVITMTQGGLMYEASVGGQKFRYESQ